ncbi:MAG: helix-turn-helix domain-containing protein [Lachnospiraceae bacterium]|nr:helix-turn-helix domain-containing protein [Lachnospiraceae bacterium]
MTLGQKLKTILKENGMTQEDLAERLDVSRQAVGKWVNDKGIPEVGKLVQISNLFGVSTDYLLKEDYEEKSISEENSISEEKAVTKDSDISNSGYYVSQEMLDGYMSYSKQNVKQITGGISLFILSNVFSGFEHQSIIMSLLYWLTMTAGIIIMIWYFFQTKQYQEIKNEHLAFDNKVFGEFKKQREIRRKRYAVMIIAGVVILLTSSEIERLLMIYFGQTACNVFGWAADTVWLALIIWAGMSMHIDSIIIKNTEHPPKNSRMKRYRWVYMALPVTVISVLIGMITNAWSPYAPIIILLCCLLVTTCKLLIESRGKDE